MTDVINTARTAAAALLVAAITAVPVAAQAGAAPSLIEPVPAAAFVDGGTHDSAELLDAKHFKKFKFKKFKHKTKKKFFYGY